MRMTSAPPAMPALRVSQPTLCPMTSTMNTLPWDAAVVCMLSMAAVAMSTADWKTEGDLSAPEVVVYGLGKAYDIESLLGEPVGRLERAVATKHAKRIETQLLVGVFHGLHLVETIFIRSSIYLKGVRLVPSSVPPLVRMPEKSEGCILR